MSTWIIAKPRISSLDAVDILFEQLPKYLADASAFFMRPSYYQSGNEPNSDSFLSELMTNKDFVSSKIKQDFFEVWRIGTPRSDFSPLLTNRLLCPVIPRTLDRDSDQLPRRRIRNRLERIMKLLEANFPDFNVLLILPDLEEYELQIRTYFLLADGYNDEVATRLARITREMVEFSTAKVRQICKERVSVVKITAKCGPIEMLRKFHDAGIPFVGDIETHALEPATTSNFYMLEARTILDNPNILSGRALQAGYTTIEGLDQISKFMLYNSPSALTWEQETEPFENVRIADLTLSNCKRRDARALTSSLWSYTDGASS